MATTRTPGQQVQDDILKTVQMSQAAVLDAIKAWAEAVQSITPELPAAALPSADKLPKPEEVGASAYDFAEQLLAGQRKFAEEVLKATAPLVPGRASGRAGSLAPQLVISVRGRAGESSRAANCPGPSRRLTRRADRPISGLDEVSCCAAGGGLSRVGDPRHSSGGNGASHHTPCWGVGGAAGSVGLAAGGRPPPTSR